MFVSMTCWVMFLTAGMISVDFTVENVPRGVLYQLKKTRRHVLLRGKRGWWRCHTRVVECVDVTLEFCSSTCLVGLSSSMLWLWLLSLLLFLWLLVKLEVNFVAQILCNLGELKVFFFLSSVQFNHYYYLWSCRFELKPQLNQQVINEDFYKILLNFGFLGWTLLYLFF